MDELLQELAVARPARAPDVAEQPFGREGVAGVGEEHLEQAQLQVGQAHRRTAGDAHALALEIEREVAGRERRRLLLARPAQQRPHPREERAGGERLGR